MDTLQIFCINLDSSTDRWNRMKALFDKYMLNVNRWKATTIEETSEYIFEDGMTLYEKACSTSHFLLWKYIVENNISKAFILEDDACFRHDWINILEDKLKKMNHGTHYF